MSEIAKKLETEHEGEGWAEIIAGVDISVALIATFIGLFFFTYGKTVEGNVVKNQMDYIVKSFIRDISVLVPPEALPPIKDKLKGINVNTPELSESDARTKANNSEKEKLAALALGSVLGFGVLIFILIAVYNKFSRSKIREILLYSFIGLGAVALTEFLFLTFYAQNYISADPNKVKLMFVQATKNFAQPVNTDVIQAEAQKIVKGLTS